MLVPVEKKKQPWHTKRMISNRSVPFSLASDDKNNPRTSVRNRASRIMARINLGINKNVLRTKVLYTVQLERAAFKSINLNKQTHPPPQHTQLFLLLSNT